MPSDGMKFEGEKSRRKVVKMLGLSVPVAGISSLTDRASAQDADPEINPCNPTCNYGYGMDVSEVADNVSPSEACKITMAGCTVYTAAAAADLVPGDEIALGLACSGGALGCTVYDALKDEHGSKQMQVARANESAGSVSNDDYIIVPSDWGW